MKKHLLFLIGSLIAFCTEAQNHPPKTPTIYVDNKGVMRWSDSRQEASFYGTNYTLPFAHAYRAIGYKALNHKAAIDKDVYHFARLGFNAYRIHLWDVELTDGDGNLLTNEHLNLMDYLISKLKERNIRIVITAQTSFGNGYPERNQPTGGFSYKYDKCNIHSNPEAIAAQERYLSDLVSHTNPYTGLAYKDDPYIIGFEINNEPCHSGTKEEVRTYINQMLNALQKAGNQKPVFYNVSHNEQVVDAYYDTAIQGTTYQWYPIGLVSGHTRTGNFLPYVDNYPIPFSTVKGFNQKARLVYEFDPADIIYSYMYPAMARTFRSAGFQWITQFAYDPMDIAYANTEYQTHYLNLAYTPGKAISMKIAAEVAYAVERNDSFGIYPADSLFSHFRVSYNEDLSEMNTIDKFYYSNTTSTHPLMPKKLKHIAGCGSSPVVQYEGKGAYFVDQLENGIWRLEVMPDAIQVKDPFAKPSLQKEVVTIIPNAWNMQLVLEDLGEEYIATALNAGNTLQLVAQKRTLHTLQPGVYLLTRKGKVISNKWNSETTWNNIRLGEYVAPHSMQQEKWRVNHQPLYSTETGQPLVLRAEIVSKEKPDSVIILTDEVSFWGTHHPSIKMRYIRGYMYEAIIPASEVKKGVFKYNLIVCRNEKQQSFPENVDGTSRDWDYIPNSYYETTVVTPCTSIDLIEMTNHQEQLELYSIPQYKSIYRQVCNESQVHKPILKFRLESDEPNTRFFLRKYIRSEINGRMKGLQQAKELCFYLKKGPKDLKVGFITSDGYTYYADCTPNTQGIIRISLSDLHQTETALLPSAYPVFMNKYFKPKTDIPFNILKIESFELSFTGKEMELELGNVWLE